MISGLSTAARARAHPGVMTSTTDTRTAGGGTRQETGGRWLMLAVLLAGQVIHVNGGAYLGR